LPDPEEGEGAEMKGELLAAVQGQPGGAEILNDPEPPEDEKF